MAKKKSAAGTASKSDAIRGVLAASPSANLQEIKEKLRAKGVKASDALINKIKYGRGRRGKKGRNRRAAGISKAEAITSMFERMGHDARPRDVIGALAKKGLKVTSAQVSTLRRKLSANGRQRRPAAATVVSLEHLLAAKQLAERLGGIRVARQAIDSLARLVEA